MKVIAIAACLSQGDISVRGQEHESASACAVHGARGERDNEVEDYVGGWGSGREMITPPIHDITNFVGAACLSQVNEEDTVCLSIRAMGSGPSSYRRTWRSRAWWWTTGSWRRGR